MLMVGYQGHTLEWINNAYCRLLDDHDTEIARFTLTGGVPETGLALAAITRDGDRWQLRAIGEGIAVKIPLGVDRGAAPVPLTDVRDTS